MFGMPDIRQNAKSGPGNSVLPDIRPNPKIYHIGLVSIRFPMILNIIRRLSMSIDKQLFLLTFSRKKKDREMLIACRMMIFCNHVKLNVVKRHKTTVM